MTLEIARRPLRVDRLQLPERADQIGMSVGEAERAFEIFADGQQLLNLTYADTKRYPPPSWVVPDFVQAAEGGAEAYTPYRGSRLVRADVAASITRFLGIEIDPDSDLALTPGTQAGLFGAVSALVEEGDRVALLDPEYLSTERMLRFCGAEVVHVALELTSEGPVVDLDALESAARAGLRLLVLSHPNNPTGAVYDDTTVRRIAEIALTHDVVVLVDQLYSRLVYDGRPFHHLAALPGMRERTITLLGPSKTEQMSGFRVGCVVAPPEVLNRIEDVQSITAIRAPAYAQHILRRWLREDTEFLDRRIEEYQAVRDMAYERLSALDVVEIHRAQGTSYMFPNVQALGRSDQDVARILLEQARVIVNPGYQFGPRGVGSFRICFAQDESVWSVTLDRIADTLTGIAEGRL